mmetsp:Transcript_5509/g.10353  ORF Transcript_5509/g.10353 Transcript_5509/m.10353 type:complete len:152 (-) Transcript_5509:56-511(-)
MKEIFKFQSNHFHVNVGGTRFETSNTTLESEEGSMLAAMFSGRHKLQQSKDGSFFLDRDGIPFRTILNYLRTGRAVLPAYETSLLELREEAEYYGLQALVEIIRDRQAYRSALEPADVSMFGEEQRVNEEVVGSSDGVTSVLFTVWWIFSH